MIRRDGYWFALAVLFTLVNVAGAGYAAAEGAAMHAGEHTVGFAIGMALVWWIRARGRRVEALPPQLPDARITELQNAVDAIALEVERIGETQRYNERIRAERPDSRP